MKNQNSLIILVVLVVIVLAGWYVYRGDGAGSFLTVLQERDTTEDVASTNNISVSDQAAGESVALDMVSLQGTFWVVVYEEKDEERGNVLGAKRLRPGDTEGTVNLLRATEQGGQYHVVLHTDNEDDRFDLGFDVLYLEEGREISTSFTAL